MPLPARRPPSKSTLKPFAATPGATKFPNEPNWSWLPSQAGRASKPGTTSAAHWPPRRERLPRKERSHSARNLPTSLARRLRWIGRGSQLVVRPQAHSPPTFGRRDRRRRARPSARACASLFAESVGRIDGRRSWRRTYRKCGRSLAPRQSARYMHSARKCSIRRADGGRRHYELIGSNRSFAPFVSE